jgi:predicted enzyme related to lactoylglutathione lyase
LARQTIAIAGEIVHYEIGAEDSDRAQAFWSGLFGWQFGPAMPEMDYRMAQINDTAGAAIFHADKPQGYPNVYHAVDDIDASAARVRELGGEAGDKSPVPGHGWFAACKDTEGNTFHLWQQDSSAGQ